MRIASDQINYSQTWLLVVFPLPGAYDTFWLLAYIAFTDLCTLTPGMSNNTGVLRYLCPQNVEFKIMLA